MLIARVRTKTPGVRARKKAHGERLRAAAKAARKREKQKVVSAAPQSKLVSPYLAARSDHLDNLIRARTGLDLKPPRGRRLPEPATVEPEAETFLAVQPRRKVLAKISAAEQRDGKRHYNKSEARPAFDPAHEALKQLRQSP